MARSPVPFLWYELIVPDPVAALDFYGAVVGWTPGPPSPAADGDYWLIGRADGGNAGGILPLTDAMRAGGARPQWLGYLPAADIDASLAALTGDGAHVLMAPWHVPGVGRMALLADPAGAPFYLMQAEPPPGQRDLASPGVDSAGVARNVFSVDRPQHVRWNELATDDPARAIAFYTRHFGWTQAGKMSMGAAGTYRFLAQDDVMIGAVMPLQPSVPRACWSFYIGVDDIDRAAAAITAGGGQILDGPHPIPGGEYSINGLDPQGAGFGLVGPRRALDPDTGASR